MFKKILLGIGLFLVASIAAVARAPRSEDEEELDEDALGEIDPNAPLEVLNYDTIEDTSNDEDSEDVSTEE